QGHSCSGRTRANTLYACPTGRGAEDASPTDAAHDTQDAGAARHGSSCCAYDPIAVRPSGAMDPNGRLVTRISGYTRDRDRVLNRAHVDGVSSRAQFAAVVRELRLMLGHALLPE